MVCVISDKLWLRVFNRDPGVLGKTVNLGNQPFTIIGVMPPQMFSPRTVDVWFPLTRRTDDQMWQSRDNHPGLFGWARLKPGVTEDKAFGEAVKYNNAIQTINPAPVYAEQGAQPGDNGDKGAQAVKRYRTDKVKEVETMGTTSGTAGSSSTPR